jgi:pimeloyl-ACP methyl ester carboxylesterase
MRPPTLLLTSFIATALGTTVIPPSPWNYTYPWPIHYHNFTSQRLNLSMAYMDIPANTTVSLSDKTIVLFHGKNFCGATWSDTAQRLSTAGYRVLIPDQIGFCKSSKPPNYQFTLHQLARNTHLLLQNLNITSTYVLGHSMGGMLALRFALMYPDTTTHLVLTNPLGLEDWKALGVPWRNLDALYKEEQATNYTSLRTYQESTYYVNTWKPEYDVWVNMLLGVYALPAEEGERFKWNMAQTTDMVLTQPVVYEFGNIQSSTLLLIGTRDTTAIGKAWSPEDVQEKVGKYEVLGKRAAERIPGAELVEFEDLGHSPQVQDSERYHGALLEWLGRTG